MNNKHLVVFFFLLTALISHSHASEFPWDWVWDEKGHTARVSSYDLTGGNGDAISIKVDETVVLADIEGAGIITHIWFTTRPSEPAGRILTLRMYWDGEETPSVEVPFGDFFAAGHGMQANVNSWPLTCASNGKARNCWWPMPFSKGARITITNEGSETNSALYYYIDYHAIKMKPKTKQRFHAQYRQAYPADSPDNYLILDARGKGMYMGTIFSVETTKTDWWGEGDDYIVADDHPTLYGTGTEDYFLDAWGIFESTYPYHGCTIQEWWDGAGKKCSMYRFHIMDPIFFDEKFHFSIEHGHANDRADNLSSVAIWYQVPPAAPFPEYPSVAKRMATEDKRDFIRNKVWGIASSGKDDSLTRLKEYQEAAINPENKILCNGMMAYLKASKELSDSSIIELSSHVKAIDELIKSQPEVTEKENEGPDPYVSCQYFLQKAELELKRKVAFKRGFKPGDDFIVESRDSHGELTPAPLYEDSDDFLNSFAKVLDPHLIGNGARFTYGKSGPYWARFTPDFPKSGRYEVLIIFPYAANASDTLYEINHSTGKMSIPVSQRGRPDTENRNNKEWISLGTFLFAKGQNLESGSITFRGKSSKNVANEQFEYRAYADSIRLVYRGEM